jgi:hypothetical protein
MMGVPFSRGFLTVPCLSSQLLTSCNCNSRLTQLTTQVKSSEIYGTTDGQSASLSWCQVSSGAQGQILITVRQLRVCWCGAPSLTRERVCRLQLLLVLTSAVILGSESRGTHDHILLSQIRDSSNLEDQVPVFISPRNRLAQLYSQTLDSRFLASYYSQGYGGGIRTRLHAEVKSQSQLLHDWRSSPSPRYIAQTGIAQKLSHHCVLSGCTEKRVHSAVP